MNKNYGRHMLAVCLLAGVLSSASAASAVSRSQPDAARRLLQDDASLCANEFDRQTTDGKACCFPVTFGGKEYNDCVSDADKLWCSTAPNDLLEECKPLDTGVREVDSSGEESSSTVEDAKDKMGDFFEGPTAAPVSEEVEDAKDKLGDFFEGPTAAPVPAERYSINDHRCSFPHEDPNGGEMVYDCFPMPEDYSVVEYDENSARTYCYIEGRSGKIEQCAVAGYKPGATTEDAAGDECFRKSDRKTVGGKTCSFPQQNTRTKEFTCDCYTIHNNAEEASYDDEVKYYCMPDGEIDGVPEECLPEEPEEEEEAAAATGGDEDEDESINDEEESTDESDEDSEEGSSSDRSVPAPEEEEDSSTEGSDTASTQSSAPVSYDDEDLPYGDDDDDNTLAIALGVGIPCGLLLLAGLAGLGYWFVKKRPAARATSFSKFEGGDNPIKGGAVSSKDVAKTGEGLSAVSRYTEA